LGFAEAVAAGVVFWTLLVAFGAAIRKGTATTVNRVEVNSFFIFVFSFESFVADCFNRRSHLYFARIPDLPPSPQSAILHPVV
jgi:hypothetical protein